MVAAPALPTSINPDNLVNTKAQPDSMTNTTQDNEMKQRSQSSELTGSLVASASATTEDTTITHHPDHTAEFYEKELKRYNVGTRDFMYNWIREKSGRVKLD